MEISFTKNQRNVLVIAKASEGSRSWPRDLDLNLEEQNVPEIPNLLAGSKKECLSHEARQSTGQARSVTTYRDIHFH